MNTKKSFITNHIGALGDSFEENYAFWVEVLSEAYMNFHEAPNLECLEEMFEEVWFFHALNYLKTIDDFPNLTSSMVLSSFLTDTNERFETDAAKKELKENYDYIYPSTSVLREIIVNEGFFVYLKGTGYANKQFKDVW